MHSTNRKRVNLMPNLKRAFLSANAVRFSFIVFSAIFILASVSTADILILKNGRSIDSPKCWEDGNLVKCMLHGQTIGYPKNDVAESKIKSVPEKPVYGFRFEVWQSGITVHQAIDVAETNNLPFSRSGLISSNKVFNPKLCRPYADTDSRFEYREQLFNKLATLRFTFTPTSKKLYSLEVVFNGTGMPKNSEFRQQMESMLREKYGKPFRVTDHILFKDYDWRINANAIVAMRPMSNAVIVTYSDVKLSGLAEIERLNNVRRGFTKGDKNKF
jgi:hypothetical protein